MCKSYVRSASSFEKIDFDAIKAEESKEGVEIAESVVKEELVDKAIYDIVSQYISDDAIKQNVLRIITRQTEYIDWANKEATISDLRRKIKRSLSYNLLVLMSQRNLRVIWYHSLLTCM